MSDKIRPDLFLKKNIEIPDVLFDKFGHFSSENEYFIYLAINDHEELLNYPDDELKKIADVETSSNKILRILVEYYIAQIVYRNLFDDQEKKRENKIHALVLSNKKFDILKKLMRKLIKLGAYIGPIIRGYCLFDIFTTYIYTNSTLMFIYENYYNLIAKDEFFHMIFREYYEYDYINIEEYNYEKNELGRNYAMNEMLSKKILEIKIEDLQKKLENKEKIIAKQKETIDELNNFISLTPKDKLYLQLCGENQ